MSMASGARWTRLLWLRLLLLCGLLEHVLCASAALKAALLRQQEEPPPKTPTPDSCVAQSLSDPGWFIYDPTYMFVNTSSPTHATDPVGHVWFTLVNRATSQTLHCLSNGVHLEPKNQKPEDGWYRCESEGTDASFHFNLTTLTISIRENWKCDGDESLQFTGNGTVDVPVILACAKEPEEAIEWCLMSNLFIKADFLSSPIAINPTTPKWPYSVDDLGGQVDDSNCDVRSRYPGWRIDNFRYRHVSTSSSGSSGIGNLSHIKGDSQYDVTFNVTNAVMNATTSCYARVNETAWPNPDHAPLWADCVTPGAAGTVGGIPPGTSAATVAGSASLDAAAAIVRTQVLVDREYGLVGINQTWRCLDGSGGVAENADNAAGGVLAAGDVASGPASDKLYGGVGYIAPVDLLCGTATSNTDTTTSLTTKEFNCTLPQNASTGVISGWAIPAPPLPHTSYMKSCTVNSVAATALQLTEYNYVSAQDQTEGSVLASIAVRNPGSGDEFHMVDVPLRVDGQWHDCVFGSQPYPWQLVTCRYMLDNGSRGVGFQLAWFCDDRDPLHPILFNATATGMYPPERCQGSEGQARGSEAACQVPLGESGLNLTISNKEWTSTTGVMKKGPLLPWI